MAPCALSSCVKGILVELEKLKGIFVPLITPLDARGEIDEAELRRFVSWLIARGVHGLYPNGSTSEFTRFTSEERRRIVRIVLEETAGRVPVVAGAAEANVKETLAACEAYAGMGARAAAIVSPFYYRLESDSVYAYFAEIARHAAGDIFLYNIPAFASPLDLESIRRLAAEFPRIIGIKDSSGDPVFMLRMLAAVRPERPLFSFLTGSEGALVPMMLCGCDGGAHAIANAIPEVTRRMYELAAAGDWSAAMCWQNRMLPLFDLTISPWEFPEGFRAAAELRGFRLGGGRQPQTEAQRARGAALLPAIRRLFETLELEAGG
jgi:4-hydroxy-tetrahydrodipicolinate synthase